MSDTTPLRRNVPFWILVAGSAAATGAGAFILVDRLGSMTTALMAQTATGVDVYVGQIQALLGAIVLGAGVVGLALALVVASIRVLFAGRSDQAPAVEDEVQDDDVDDVDDEEPAGDADSETVAEDAALGYDADLGYTKDDLTPTTR